MESFKEKLPIIIVAIIMIAFIAGAYYLLVIHKDLYYTQIDNTKIQEVTSSGDMKYEYTLIAYNKNGKVMQIRGVVNWKEVQANELPSDVKTAMNIE